MATVSSRYCLRLFLKLPKAMEVSEISALNLLYLPSAAVICDAPIFQQNDAFSLFGNVKIMCYHNQRYAHFFTGVFQQ
jgi:hypothetical protein